jgi:tetratricopeptide (TPR) repeat protein
LAPVLSNLALLQYLKHNLPDAESLYKRSVRLWSKATDARSISFGRTLQNFGEMYLQQRKYDEAGTLFAQALPIKEAAFGPDHAEVAEVLVGSALADMLRGYYTEAEPSCQRAMAILEKSSPRDYRALAQVSKVYAWLLQKTNRKAQAEVLETKAMVYTAKSKDKLNKELAGAFN